MPKALPRRYSLSPRNVNEGFLDNAFVVVAGVCVVNVTMVCLLACLLVFLFACLLVCFDFVLFACLFACFVFVLFFNQVLSLSKRT